MERSAFKDWKTHALAANKSMGKLRLEIISMITSTPLQMLSRTQSSFKLQKRLTKKVEMLWIGTTLTKSLEVSGIGMIAVTTALGCSTVARGAPCRGTPIFSRGPSCWFKVLYSVKVSKSMIRKSSNPIPSPLLESSDWFWWS